MALLRNISTMVTATLPPWSLPTYSLGLLKSWTREGGIDDRLRVG
jgi:hypothetical protein